MLLVTEVAPPHTLPPSNIANSVPCTHLTLGYSPKLVELDFSHLLAKWVGYAPRALPKRTHLHVPTPRRSSSLTALRKGAPATLLWAIRWATPLRAPLTVRLRRWALLGRRDTFYGLLARTDPKKV
jgi:hypothetical protein